MTEAVMLLGLVRLSLWLLPFQIVRRVLARLMKPLVGASDHRRRSRKSIVWAVEAAGRGAPMVRTCLTQALTAQVLLTRSGYPALLRIGVVRGMDGELEAHAWVESEGEVMIGGQELTRYVPLVSLPARQQ